MKNYVVWFDIPVRNLARATTFYSTVLQVKINNGEPKYPAALFDQKDGVSGCLFFSEEEQPSATGPLLYFEVNGRLSEATSLVEKMEGKILKPKHSIEPHGFISVVLDSEGNRIALHSETDS